MASFMMRAMKRSIKGMDIIAVRAICQEVANIPIKDPTSMNAACISIDTVWSRLWAMESTSLVTRERMSPICLESK